MKKYYLLIIAAILFNTDLKGQSQFTLYQLNSSLPQSNLVNAGAFPNYKVSIGIPVLSSVYISGDMGQLSYNRIFTRGANDSLYFDAEQLNSYLDENNHIAAEASDQLLSLGLRLKKNYFSLSLSEKVEGGLSYPKSLVKLISSGDGINIGQVFAFDELGARAQIYHELAIGYGREINEKLTVGVRMKFLSGIASIDTDKIGASLLVSPDSLYLYSPAFNVNTSGLDLFDADTDIFKAATAFNNFGFSLDIGAQYWLTDKLQLSAALNDMGGINWKKDTRQYQFPEVRYAYSGMDLVAAINDDPDALFQQETDSLINSYEPDTVDGIGYRSQLIPKFYAGAAYHLGKSHTFGAMLYGDVFKGNFKPAFGLSYNLQLGHIWTIGVNGSYRNKSFENVGIGTTITLGAFQIYAVTENITAITHITDARFVDLRFGMNLVFGKIKKSKKTTTEKENNPLSIPAVVVPDTATLALNEPVSSAIMGTAIDELDVGYYIIIASFNTKEESDVYSSQLQYEGYAALSGYQSERSKYYSYLMYSPDDGNKIIEKKNNLKDSFAPGLEIPWVLWVKPEE
jgi:hypothetical protein